MDKEDKMIRELLEEGFLQAAPEGFTGKVMDNIEADEVKKETSPLLYPGLIFGAAILSVSAIYLTNPKYLVSYFNYFIQFVQSIIFSIGIPFRDFSFSDLSFQGSGMFFGILLIVGLLLLLDRLITSGNRKINLFL